MSITTLIKERLAGTRLCEQETPDGRSVADWFVDCMIKLAMEGHGSYMKEVIDRNDGKIPDPVDTPAVTMESVAEMEELDARLDDPVPTEDDAGQVP